MENHPKLPSEVWLKVFTFLEPSELSMAAQTCHLWAQLIASSGTLWKTKCLSEHNQEIRQQMLQDKTQKNWPWKEVFQNNFGRLLIKRQWFDGKFSNIKHEEELPAKVFCPMDLETWGEIFERELSR